MNEFCEIPSYELKTINGGETGDAAKAFGQAAGLIWQLIYDAAQGWGFFKKIFYFQIKHN